MGREITVSVSCTSRCDTGCRHCCDNSCPSGIDLSLEKLDLLKKSIEDYNGQVYLCLSGGGEPLMWPNLIEAIKIFGNNEKIDVALVTSGCLSEKDKRFETLKEIFEIDNFISTSLSFNLFSSSFPRRLAFTLPFILQKTERKYNFIKVVADFYCEENSIIWKTGKTITVFEEALERAIGKCSRLCFAKGKAFEDFSERSEASYDLSSALVCSSFLNGTLYAPYDKKFEGIEIFVVGQVPKLVGRAEKLVYLSDQLAYYNFAHSRCVLYDPYIYLAPDGKFKLCFGDICKDLPPFDLGSPGEDLKKSLQKKAKIGKLRDKTHWFLTKAGNHPCKLCKERLWELWGEGVR
jgi:organic radical activating enzyme